MLAAIVARIVDTLFQSTHGRSPCSERVYAPGARELWVVRPRTLCAGCSAQSLGMIVIF